MTNFSKIVNDKTARDFARSMQEDIGGNQQDYGDRKLYTALELNLELLVWSVVNDGIVEENERVLLLNALSHYGVPNNQHTLMLLDEYLDREIRKHANEHGKLGEKEKAERLALEKEIKEEMKRRLEQEQQKIELAEDLEEEKRRRAEERRNGAGNDDFLEQILARGKGARLFGWSERLKDTMGIIKEEGSFVERYQAEKQHSVEKNL